VEYNPTFHLYLHTKLANPHYKPELQAQTTLINFTVTRQGLLSVCGNAFGTLQI
jgi:dynein heavy chain, axonemal